MSKPKSYPGPPASPGPAASEQADACGLADPEPSSSSSTRRPFDPFRWNALTLPPGARVDLNRVPLTRLAADSVPPEAAESSEFAASDSADNRNRTTIPPAERADSREAGSPVRSRVFFGGFRWLAMGFIASAVALAAIQLVSERGRSGTPRAGTAQTPRALPGPEAHPLVQARRDVEATVPTPADLSAAAPPASAGVAPDAALPVPSTPNERSRPDPELHDAARTRTRPARSSVPAAPGGASPGERTESVGVHASRAPIQPSAGSSAPPHSASALASGEHDLTRPFIPKSNRSRLQ